MNILPALRRRLGELVTSASATVNLLDALGDQVTTLQLARALVVVDELAEALDEVHDALQDAGDVPAPGVPAEVASGVPTSPG